MIAVDTNILVYAHREDSNWHDVASRVIRRLAEGASPWAIPWPCIHEFLALVSHPRIYNPPTPFDLALRQVDAWLKSPTLVLLSEDPGYWATICALLKSARIAGGQVHDARVAALCLRAGVRELWSADRDFSRFPPLKLRNPLIER